MHKITLIFFLLIMNSCTSLPKNAHNISIVQKDKFEEASFLIGKVFLKNNKLIFVKLNNDSKVKQKIHQIILAINAVNKIGFIEIEVGGQDFTKEGSSIRWDGVKRIELTDSREFWNALTSYIYGEYKIIIKVI